MYDPKILADVFARNQWVIDEQTKGLSHADSLIQPTSRGNCLNYVLGHMIANRETILTLLDLALVMTPEQNARYGYGSDPVLEDGLDVIPLEELLAMVKHSGEILAEAIATLSAEDLAREIKRGEGVTTVGQRVEFYVWHDTYHVGQTEYLRQLAGTDDKVI